MRTNQESDQIPGVLRRRYKDLSEEHAEAYVRVFRHAADELEARQKWQDGGERGMVQLVSDNRKLRNLLVELYGRVKGSALPRRDRAEICKRVAGTLNQIREPWVGRHVVAIEVGKAESREQAEAQIKVVFDAYYGGALERADEITVKVLAEEIGPDAAAADTREGD